jgi:signal transduction histidine kinase
VLLAESWALYARLANALLLVRRERADRFIGAEAATAAIAFFTTKPSGMGLGLSICRAIVDDHGGDLRLSKTDSHGTSFELIFPGGSASGART